MRTSRRLGEIPPGALLAVLADDPLAALDIAHLCAAEGHELLARDAQAPAGWRFLIRRRPG